MIEHLNASGEIEKISYDILRQCKAWGKFPTPVNDIIKFTELRLNENPYINDIPKHYISKSADVLKRALRKINGILDRQTKIIYVDIEQLENRKRYIKLHEVGHEVIPWQKEMYEILEDDEITISDIVKDEFEAEANYFASATLFQLERFDEEANRLPLEIGSAFELAKMFGGSVHATLRRYVENSSNRCALLVLKDKSLAKLNCTKRNYFQSSGFSKTFGILNWSDLLGVEWPFVQDYIKGRKLHTEGFFTYTSNGSGAHHFNYHFFNNSWNAFVLMIPVGEFKSSKSKIVYTR
jgi:Zn-dependent peptidase ImmA (M78 family)